MNGVQTRLPMDPTTMKFAYESGIQESITIKGAGVVKGLSMLTIVKIMNLIASTVHQELYEEVVNRTGFSGGRCQPARSRLVSVK